MSNIYSINTRKKLLQNRDEWPEIGVHLETRVANGMSKDEAVNSLIIDGVDTIRVEHYLKCFGFRNGERLQEVNDLYSKEENTAIQQWILNAPYHPDSRDDSVINANRVAELVLLPVRSSLPQWALVYDNGKVLRSREYQLKKIRKRDKLLQPIFLFQINWADSGPGICWPEEYYLTLLPGYNISVLTASQDSAEMHGYADIALDHLPYSEDVFIPFKPVLEVIKGWWQRQCMSWDQGPWESLWSPGQFDPHKLLSLRDKIWSTWMA